MIFQYDVKQLILVKKIWEDHLKDSLAKLTFQFSPS